MSIDQYKRKSAQEQIAQVQERGSLARAGEGLLMGATRSEVHFVHEEERSRENQVARGGPSGAPSPEMACGIRLYEVRHDLAGKASDGGEFVVNCLAASGRLESVTCVACLRALARKGLAT